VRQRQLLPGIGSIAGSAAHQHGSVPAFMPQLNTAPQRAHRDSAGLLLLVIAGEAVHCQAQELELRVDTAAALADRQVHAQRNPLAERELSVFALR
jgi:hypothetical protein